MCDTCREKLSHRFAASAARFRGRREPRIAPEYALEQNKLKVVGGIYRLKNGRVDMVA